jgi:hypothetical protein
MCHAQLDPKLLMQDAERRYRAAQPASVTAETQDGATIPPDLMGGVRGIVARLMARLARLSNRARAVAVD